jgi:hypothetical protein
MAFLRLKPQGEEEPGHHLHHHLRWAEQVATGLIGLLAQNAPHSSLHNAVDLRIAEINNKDKIKLNDVQCTHLEHCLSLFLRSSRCVDKWIKSYAGQYMDLTCQLARWGAWSGGACRKPRALCSSFLGKCLHPRPAV